MKEINLLDKSVYNRIAAGEVVERPLSIVKELIENSIDAGATAVSIDIRNGGMTRISVSDNGKGISPEDVPTAFMAHATSKIKCADDLDNIATLGFRGEALPSIAAVSCVKMNTRIPGSETGFSYTVDNGEVTDSGLCGCPVGTNVTVTNLFDKIPARKKFIKKASLEEAAITNTVSRLILANYRVAFKYSINGKVTLRSSGQSMESAIYAVYGKDFFDSLLPVNAAYMDVSLSGYACKPSSSKHSKSFQTLIVNGRYVYNEDVSYWIYGCYMNYLMKRQYPAYVLYLNLPFDLVDVNVHPNKLEIKFADETLVKKIITDAVKHQIVDNLMLPKNFVADPLSNLNESSVDSNDSDTIYAATRKAPEKIETNPENEKFNSSILGEIRTERIQSNYVEPSAFSDSAEKNSYRFFQETIADLSKNGQTGASDNHDSYGENNHVNADANKTFFKKLVEEISDSDVTRFTDSKSADAVQQYIDTEREVIYCGKLFNTYLIYECGNDAYIIDQHAAHERILYDKLVDSYNNHSLAVQQMLIPYTFTLNAEESENFSARLNELKEYGFQIERYEGTTFSLKSVPSECAEMDIADFINRLIQNINLKIPIAKTDSFKDKLAQWACKAAVKGGMDIPQREIDELIRQTVTNGRILVCPHGRPIIIRLAKTDIEKMLKRIV